MKERSLSGRLVTLYVTILSLALVLVSLVVMFIMTRVLTDQVDTELSSAGAIIAQETLNSSLTGQPGLIPSPYYVYVPVSGGDPIERFSEPMKERYGVPDDIEKLFEEAPGEPITLDGSGTSLWRAVWLQTDSTEFPAVAIAQPLESLTKTLSRMTVVMVVISLTVIGVGAIASYLLVQRSLRPLRTIENTTRQIAYGHLSQRVPTHGMGAEIGQLGDSFNIMLTQIESAMASRERSEGKMRQFISDASHELRTPLASVRGYAELYRMGGVGADQVPSAMARIEAEAKRMGGLVDDLLQLARLDESRPLNRTKVDLLDLAAEAVMDFNARAPEYPTTLLSTTPVPAYVERDKISQVIANLLTNVKQHTPEGTAVEVSVGAQDVESPHGPVTLAVIDVADHGPGIPPETRQKVFERFYRVDTSRSRASGGSGLGLAIVSSIAAAHRGSASISETPGGGTTVTLTFPTNIEMGEDDELVQPEA